VIPGKLNGGEVFILCALIILGVTAVLCSIAQAFRRPSEPDDGQEAPGAR
jgi:hypothetical protein